MVSHEPEVGADRRIGETEVHDRLHEARRWGCARSLAARAAGPDHHTLQGRAGSGKLIDRLYRAANRTGAQSIYLSSITAPRGD